MTIGRKVLYSAILAAVTLIFSIQDPIVLSIQKLFCITACPVKIGKASLTPPEGWLLESSRSDYNKIVFFYGLVPQLIEKNTSYPKSRYFLFRSLNEQRESIAMIQMDGSTKSKIESAKGRYADENGTICEAKNENFRGFKLFECSSKDFYVLLLPELEIIFILSQPSIFSLKEVKMEVSATTSY